MEPRRDTTARWKRYLSVVATGIILAICKSGPSAADPIEDEFLARQNAAMDVMMRDMNVAPSGDVDHDFVAQMVPHHRGAIEMAQSELRYGRNTQLLRIAQEIIVTQAEEITAMRRALTPHSSDSRPANNRIPSESCK